LEFLAAIKLDRLLHTEVPPQGQWTSASNVHVWKWIHTYIYICIYVYRECCMEDLLDACITYAKWCL